jgi:hypothetical protein
MTHRAVSEAFVANGINHWRGGTVLHPASPGRAKLIASAGVR